jgi:hypothetical protein
VALLNPTPTNTGGSVPTVKPAQKLPLSVAHACPATSVKPQCAAFVRVAAILTRRPANLPSIPHLLTADIQTNGVRVDTRACPVGGGLAERIRIGEPPLAGGRRASLPGQDNAKPCIDNVCYSRACHSQQPRFLVPASPGLHGSTLVKSKPRTCWPPLVIPSSTAVVSVTLSVLAGMAKLQPQTCCLLLGRRVGSPAFGSLLDVDEVPAVKEIFADGRPLHRSPL